MIAKWFGVLLLWLYDLFENYGVAIILFALVVKLILLPFQLKSKKSMMRMSRMSPRLKELEKKYGNDRQKYQEEMNKLYREEGVNPMSGCLWSLLPFPILIVLYKAIRYPITVMMGVSEDLLAEGGAIYEKLVSLGYNLTDFSTGRNASVYEQIYQSDFINNNFQAFEGLSDKLQQLNYKFLGINLSQVPNIKFWNWGADIEQLGLWCVLGLFLIPIVSAFLSWLSMKISNATNPQASADANQQTKSMMIWMPLISLWICFTMPAVMGIYWIAQSAFAIIQEIILNKIYGHQLDIEDADRIERDRARAAELEAKREETERLKAEGKTVVNVNTSKKKQQAVAAQKEAERKAAEARAARLAKRGDVEEIPESQVDNRRYARGRAYVADRYTNPETAVEKTQAAAEESEEFTRHSESESIETNPEEVFEGGAVTEVTKSAEAEEIAETEETIETEEVAESEESAEAEENAAFDGVAEITETAEPEESEPVAETAEPEVEE